MERSKTRARMRSLRPSAGRRSGSRRGRIRPLDPGRETHNGYLVTETRGCAIENLNQPLLAIRSRFTRRARLEAENLLIAPIARGSMTQVSNANETVEHRWVWLYRLYPSLLDAIIIVVPPQNLVRPISLVVLNVWGYPALMAERLSGTMPVARSEPRTSPRCG